MQSDLIIQILRSGSILAGYILMCLIILVPVRVFTKLPSFVFRKLLHTVAFTAVSLMILTSSGWQAAALVFFMAAVFSYPVLTVMEKSPWYGKLFVQKSPGEMKRSLLLFFLMLTVEILVVWGIFGRPVVAAAAILMWGSGDAAAALVGIPFGRHKVRLRFADGKKSWEGSLAMLLVSMLAGCAILLPAEGNGQVHALLAAVAGALAGTMTELFSRRGFDTVSVPAVIAATLLIFG